MVNLTNKKNAPGTEENCPNAFSEEPAITSSGLPQLDADLGNRFTHF
jgi:hypothetical protein